MAGTLIAGRYRLDTLLGRGGMSEVWCATDEELGRRLALKLLSPNEDTARSSARHADGRPFIVLEYLPGGTLEGMLRANDALADEEAHRIAGRDRRRPDARTHTASCTATSSRRTCSSTTRGARSSPTSASRATTPTTDTTPTTAPTTTGP